MSRLRLGKKLQPAAKALKRITDSLKSKLQNFDVHDTIRVIKSNTNRFIAYCSNHVFVPLKRRFLTKPPHPRYQYYYQHYYQSYSRKNRLPNSSPIYIDKLYEAEHAGTSSSSSRGKQVVASEKKGMLKKDGKTEREKILYSIEDAWREVVAKSPQLRPVDERAEEFIYNFRQDMKLQKERSNLEFQEMLARSS